LIIYGFTSRSRIFLLYGDVTIAGEGLQNLGLCSALRAFVQGGIFIMPHLQATVTRGLGFSGFIRWTVPFSRLLRHTRGCGGSILTRILTRLYKVYALYLLHVRSFHCYHVAATYTLRMKSICYVVECQSRKRDVTSLYACFDD
jgi:hypothetical protein